MKKILVDAHCFDSNAQGIVSYVQGLYFEILKHNDFDVTFACSNINKIKQMFGCNIKCVKIPKSSFFYRLFYFFPKLLKSNDYDFVHFQYIIPFFLNKNVKYITTIHDIIPIDFPKYYSFLYKFKVNFLFRYAAKKSDVLLTVSEYSKHRIAQRFRINENEIIVTNNAVKDVFLNNTQNSENQYGKYILFVSRIEERKNHLLLLKAFFDGYFYKDYNLLFVGSCSAKNNKLFAYYEALSSEKKSKVKFISGVSDSELSKIYKNAELFVYPSIAEGFGIPPLEAAMYGKKVICSNSTAMNDFSFFKDYLFDPFNENELIQKINKAIADTKYPSESIKQEIKMKYSWKTSSNKFTKILQKYYNGGG